MRDKTGRIQRIVIAGGGTSGWMTAAALARVFEHSNYKISLIESPSIGTVGVGEATIPALAAFNKMLGIDEVEFMKNTQGTFKSGIEFVNWSNLSSRYFHGFGGFGVENHGLAFHNYWFKWKKEHPDSILGDYSTVVESAKKEKFLQPSDSKNPLVANMRYAYHLDAGLYANFLRDYSTKRGVNHIQGEINNVVIDPDNGYIKSLLLKDGSTLEGDFFIDCTGFRSLLLGQALKVPYISWQKWLFCNSAVAVPSERVSDPLPYTRATAHIAGWQWRIPLQHRTGNGLVFSKDDISDQDAQDLLLANIDGKPTAEPRFLRFTPGMRERMWEKNCVAIGLSSGFIEPLESTSIHMIQSSIIRLTQLFPGLGINEHLVKKFNQGAMEEIVEVRDFIIMHYCTTKRTDSPFWQRCRALSLPDSLNEKIEQFKQTGRITSETTDVFNDLSWVSVLCGQELNPVDYHPVVDLISSADLGTYMGQIRSSIEKLVDKMPSHEQYIQRHMRKIN